MTGPVTTEALVESLASEIADILLDGGALSPKDFAQRLVAGPALQQVTAERDEETQRANEAVIRAGALEQERNHLRHHYDAAMAAATNDDLPADVKMTLAERVARYRDRWLSATSELARLRAEGEALKEDAARLDFLDGCNARLNASYGTHYGWKLVLNHNVNRLVLGDMKVDLHDSEGGNDKLPSCRLAIDEARKRTALARAATAREG